MDWVNVTARAGGHWAWEGGCALALSRGGGRQSHTTGGHRFSWDLVCPFPNTGMWAGGNGSPVSGCFMLCIFLKHLGLCALYDDEAGFQSPQREKEGWPETALREGEGTALTGARNKERHPVSASTCTAGSASTHGKPQSHRFTVTAETGFVFSISTAQRGVTCSRGPGLPSRSPADRRSM